MPIKRRKNNIRRIKLGDGYHQLRIMEIPTITATRILLAIDSKANYYSEIARKTGTTIGAVIKILANFETHGMVKQFKEGRKKLVQITEKGERLKYLLQGVIEL